MKKQFLSSLTNKFPQALDCSSIRINAEQNNEILNKKEVTRPNNGTNGNKKQVNFAENSVVGLQISLQMGNNRQTMMQLMRSKSQASIKNCYLQPIKKQKEQTVLWKGSLYNTNSFNDMTMKISSNTRQNDTHIQQQGNKINDNYLQKPQLMNSHKSVFYDTQMSINKSKTNNNSHLQNPVTKQQRLKTLIQSLKCSMTQSQKQQIQQQNNQSSHYEQPYFKIPSLGHNNSNKLQERENKLINQNNRRDIKVQTVKSADKRITLRDYLYLQKLSNKTQNQQSPTYISQAASSPKLQNSRSKRKIPPTNAEVMKNIKTEILKHISLIQTNMALVNQLVQSSMNEEIDNKELMKMYSLGRIVKDHLVTGNDVLVRFLKQNPERDGF